MPDRLASAVLGCPLGLEGFSGLALSLGLASPGGLEVGGGTGRYLPYESLVARAAAAEGLDQAAAQRLTQAYGQLRPWPEAPRVLAAIAAAMPIGTVTNCSDELRRQAAGLVGVPFEVTVTAQSAGAYKPQPEPYRRALDALALPAERVLFVAGSPYDISGAGQLGMDVWWHNRAGMPARPGSRPVAEHRSLGPLPAFAC